MISRRTLTAVLLSFVSALSLQQAPAQDDAKADKERSEIDARAADTLSEFLALEGGQALFDKAQGYAVFRVTKGGFGASGAGGRGIAVDKRSGERVYMGVGAAGVGFTFGVSRYDVVILFETTEKIRAFSTGGWDSSATAQAAAGSNSAAIGSTFFDGVAYYQLARKGLMASADVSGTRFFVLDGLN
jgi:lipid-binding SYLF domain-containing protein